jgi:hypothetical protein
MIELFRKIFLRNKYGSGKDGNIVIDEDITLLRDMEYKTLKIVKNASINLNNFTIKVLRDEKINF